MTPNRVRPAQAERTAIDQVRGGGTRREPARVMARVGVEAVPRLDVVASPRPVGVEDGLAQDVAAFFVTRGVGGGSADLRAAFDPRYGCA